MCLLITLCPFLLALLTSCAAAQLTAPECKRACAVEPSASRGILMHPSESRLLRSNMYNSSTYLEWGSGGSTFEAIRANLRVVSVENHAAYCLHMMRDSEIRCAICKRQLLYICAPGPPTKALGEPKLLAKQLVHTRYGGKIVDENIARDHAHYVLVSEFLHGFEPESGFDTILVDGRFRVACTLRAAAQHAHSQTALLVHDFGRKQYAPLRSKRFGFTVKARSARLAQLRIPANASTVLSDKYSEFLQYWY